ncbi:DJR-1.1 protein [Aphelenchoides avenae]|nr:DJR-1.1 protein [Aphelenchus avenae]
MNNDYDLVVIPGGPGHKHIAECEKTGEFLRRHEKAGKLIGAICGGPLALQAHKIGEGGNMTLFPKEKDNMAKGAQYNYTGDRVTVWKNIVTSQAPGTAFEFATKLVELLLGGDKAKETCEKLLCQCPSMTAQAPRIR